MKRLLIASLVLFGCAHPPPVKPAAPEGINQQWLQENAATHNHDVMNCYQRRLKEDTHVSGDLVLEFHVTPTGEMVDTKVVRPVDKKLDECVLNEAKAWKFPWNAREGATQVLMRDTFSVKMSDNAPHAEFAEIQIDETKASIQEIVQFHIDEVRACYRERKKDHPKASGKIVLEWDVDDNGDVHAAHAKRSVDRDLEECLIGKLKTWKFRAAPKNMVSREEFAFMFNSGEHTREE